MSSFDIKERFAERYEDPEKNVEKLRTAYTKHTNLILSGKAWDDDGSAFMKSENEFKKWAILPPLTPQQQGQQPPQQISAPSPSLNMPAAFLHAGYPGVILLAVMTFGLVFLAYRKILPANFAGFAIILGVLLFFLPAILDRLIKMLPVERMLGQKEKSISELFDEAHKDFMDTIVSVKNEGKYEHTGKPEKDAATHAKLNVISRLMNIYGEIFFRAEREWYGRAIANKEYATRMTGGSGALSQTSDVPG